MTDKRNQLQEKDQPLNALLSNAGAVEAITSAVESTLGPRGLDTMLVDRRGDIVVTNAGVTILDLMDVSHPAGRMLINVARSQHREIGDGTTTATIMAGTIISQGVNHYLKGVPITRILEGIRLGINKSLEILRNKTIPVEFPHDERLFQTALISGRGEEEMARMAVESAKLMGEEKLMDPSFKLRDMIVAVESAESEIFQGVLLKKRPLNDSMPEKIENCKILCIDDALDTEKPQEGSLQTEMGFRRYLEKQELFLNNIKKIVNMGFRLVLTERGISDRAEEILTAGGVLAVSRCTSRMMNRVCKHTGATPIKIGSLEKNPEELEKYSGFAGQVIRDKYLNNIRITHGKGEPAGTFIVGAPTQEVLEEKERIAGDAVSSVQSAVRGGILPGGGSCELATALELSRFRSSVQGMTAYGVDCVIEALKKPMAKIIQNAGYNPLEKMEDIISAQLSRQTDSLALDCDTGEIMDMKKAGVFDPTLVKLHALKTAGEVSRAILRINTIIKMKDTGSSLQTPADLVV